MSNDFANDQNREALKVVLQKAATDAAFRAKALSDSAAAIKEATGVDVPAGLTIVFVDSASSPEKSDSANGKYVIVLPPLESGEITDEELLENVAGGTGKVVPAHTTDDCYQPIPQ